MRLKLLSNKILLKVLIAILLFFTMLPVIYYRQLYHQKKIAAFAAQSGAISLATDKITAVAIEIENSSGAYLLTDMQQFRKIYLQSKINIALQKNEIKKLITADKLQQQTVDSLLWYAGKKIAFTDSTASIQNHNNKQAALQLLTHDATRLYTPDIYRLAGKIHQQQNIAFSQQKNEQYNAITTECQVTLAFTFVLLVSAVFFSIKNKLTRTKKEVLFKENASLLSLQINQSNNQFISWISIKKY